MYSALVVVGAVNPVNRGGRVALGRDPCEIAVHNERSIDTVVAVIIVVSIFVVARCISGTIIVV